MFLNFKTICTVKTDYKTYDQLIYKRELISLTLLSQWGEGGGEVIFARSKCKFKLFLNDLWYEPETL